MRQIADISLPPESRQQLREKQPQYYQWLADLFDYSKGALKRPIAPARAP